MKFKNLKNIIFTIVFLAIIIAPMFVWDIIEIVSVNNPKIIESIDFDLGEKRNKATLSEIIDVEILTKELESYYNDRIPFRSYLISIKQQIDSLVETPYTKNIEPFLLQLFSKKKAKSKNLKAEMSADIIDGEIKLYMDEAVDMYRGHKLKPNEIEPYDSNIEFPIKYLNKSVIMGQNNWPYLNYNNIDYYKGINNLKANEYADYIKPYENFYKLCKKFKKELLFVICPEKEEVYPEYMPTMEIVDSIERPLRVRDYIATASNLLYVYPKEKIVSQKLNYRTYLKYDSHWSTAGGYIAANEVKKALGYETTPLKKWNIKKVPENRKDLLFLGGVDIFSYTDSFMYEIDYKPEVKVDTIYKDDAISSNIEITHSNGDIKKSVILIGDSYRYDLFEVFKKDFTDVSCFSYVEIGNPLIKRKLKEADLVIIQAVERHENITIPEILKRSTKYLNES